MKPKICIILTPDGIDTVTVLSTGGTRVRKEGYKICSFIENEITDFERIVCSKLKKSGHGYSKGNEIKK
ncbi:hypothetical protein MYX76_00915 [Desulfobacterota bacterium AH_259_B03_O07]|nr:hypothetical protein [Desulfobacterota bacterium AH_259_B03_O07]